MVPIFAVHDDYYDDDRSFPCAVDLPDVEPDSADVIALSVLDADDDAAFELEQSRIEAQLAELSLYGGVDELEVRRHRRRVHQFMSRVLAGSVASVSGVAS